MGSEGQGEAGRCRIIYLYVVVAARIYLMRCYAKNVKTDLTADELEQVWPRPIDVKAIRRQVKMSQTEFPLAYGIGKRALQEWEQGGRQPDSAARAYLTVIAEESAIVRRVLAEK